MLDIIFIGLCATVSGANDFVGMAEFGKSKRAWLERFLELAHGIPSHDTFNRVLSALDPAGFVGCFLSWVEDFQEATAGRVISIDGKTARATLDRAKGKNPLHVVSAGPAQNRLVLGQEVVDEKSNEITAIPKLLEVLELAGAIVTIDAMGCQKDIAARIREKGRITCCPSRGTRAIWRKTSSRRSPTWTTATRRGSPTAASRRTPTTGGRRRAL